MLITTCIAFLINLLEVQCGNNSVSNCSCGLDYSHRGRIYGGKFAVEAEFPWQVLLFKDDYYFCGGSIINNLFILSAAHCFMKVVRGKIKIVYTRSLSILLGGHDTRNIHEDKENPNIRHSLYVIFHKFYRVRDFVNDIALIRLKEPIEEYSFKILPVCLPPIGESFEGLDATVTGWGAEFSNGESVNVLKKAELRVFSNSECNETLGKYFLFMEEYMMCAASPGQDSCHGDSGGPLVIKSEMFKYIQIGVVSFGFGCGNYSIPGTYTRLNRYLRWIKNHTSDATYCEH